MLGESLSGVGGVIQLPEQLLAGHLSLINREIASGENYSGIRALNVFSLPYKTSTQTEMHTNKERRKPTSAEAHLDIHMSSFFFLFDTVLATVSVTWQTG